MPGYGVVGATAGAGLLPWSWAADRLVGSHDYWVATVTPAGTPHVMPVWGVWADGAFWFSSSVGSRKARNLAVEPHATVTTADPQQPVVVEGVVETARDAETIAEFLAHLNAKYEVDYGLDFLDPDVNGTFRLGPLRAFALDEEDFTGTPTCFEFVGR
jgi:hypothetical protein